jgi:TolC family type I secretion outer membrane protein
MQRVFALCGLLGLCAALAGPAAATDLRSALTAAEVRDPKLAAARSNRDAAAEYVPLAQSRLLPQVSLQGSAQRLHQTTTEETLLGERETKFVGPSGSAQLALRQGLYRPRDRLGLDIGELQAEVGSHQLASASSELWRRASTAWLDVLLAESQHEAMGEAMAAAERTQAQARRRLNDGDGTRDAVAEAEAQFAAARARVNEAALLRDARQRQFAALTGLAGVALDNWRLPQQLPAPLARSEAEFIELLLARNPELRAAAATSAVSEKRLAQARADHMPSLDLVASASRSQNDTAANVGSRYRYQQIGVQFSLPLFTGGGLSAAERQAAAFSMAAANDRDAYAENLRLRASELWASEQGLRERIAGAAGLVEASREQLHAAEQGLRHGVRSIGDVSAAATQLANRRRDLAELRYTLLSTQAQLLAGLPTDDPAWAGWIGGLESVARLR